MAAISAQYPANKPMKRIIVIDGCFANIIFPSNPAGLPVEAKAVTGGRLVKAASLLARAGRNVTVMGEAGRDPLGDLIMRHLDASGADTSCIDRYSDGNSTPSVLIFPSSEGSRSIVYFKEFSERWDSKWPRTDASDIIVFGGFFPLQQRVRQRLVEFLTNARQRGALTLYMPGFNPALAPAVTRVMPALLENLEMADAVITFTPDIVHLFGESDAARCFRDKISFYSPLMVNIDPTNSTLTLFQGPDAVTRQISAECCSPSPLLSAIPVARFATALSCLSIAPSTLGSLNIPTLESIADLTADVSTETSPTITL